MPYGQASSFNVSATPRGRGVGYTDKLPSSKRHRRVLRESFRAQHLTTAKPTMTLSPRAIMIRANHARRREAWLRKHAMES
jgi:hypothetical protein